jgi:hypothetical protein
VFALGNNLQYPKICFLNPGKDKKESERREIEKRERGEREERERRERKGKR